MEDGERLLGAINDGSGHYGSCVNREDADDTPQPIIADGGKRCWVPCRYQLSFLTMWGFANTMALRVNLNIALVSMVNMTEDDTWNSTDQCPRDYTNITNVDGANVEFDWTATQQSILLGAFYYGYPLLQIPGGYMAERFGPKLVFGLAIFIPAILTLLTPIVAYWGPEQLIALRVIMGLCMGPTLPSHHVLWTRWAPPLERGKLMSFSFMGISVGTVSSYIVTGYLCDGTFLGGWPATFYVFGTLGCVWFFLWMISVYNSPSNHPWISAEEKYYILESTDCLEEVKYRSPPWRSLLTSRAVIVLVIVSLCDNFCAYGVFNCAPLFMKQILGVDIEQTGLFSSMPYIASGATCFIGGALADLLQKKGISTGAARKIITFLALSLCGTFLGCIALVECNRTAAVALLTSTIAAEALNTGGYFINPIDIAPMYAGTIFGLTNAVGDTGGFMAPAILNLLTHGEPSRSRWQNFLFLSGGVSLFGAVLFAFLGTGEEQSWAKQRRLSDEQESCVNQPVEDA